MGGTEADHLDHPTRENAARPEPVMSQGRASSLLPDLLRYAGSGLSCRAGRASAASCGRHRARRADRKRKILRESRAASAEPAKIPILPVAAARHRRRPDL